MYHDYYYSSAGSFLPAFSLFFRSFFIPLSTFILARRIFRVFLLSTMMIFPFGGGLDWENNVGATDKLAALYRASRISAFPFELIGNSSLLFQAFK